MDIDQKTISSYVTYSSLGILFLGALIILYVEISSKEPVIPSEHIDFPEVNVLTSAEVAFEKQKLAERSLSKTPNITEIDEPIEEIKFSTPEEATNFKTQTIIEIPDGSKLEQIRTVRVYDPFANTNNTSSNQIDNFAEKILMTIEGTIYSKVANRVLVAQNNGTGFGIVNTDSNTKIQINGKIMNFSDLKIGDKVLAEGFGLSGSAEITASVLAVTGSLQVMPI